MFGTNWMHSLMTYEKKKSFLSIQFYKEIHWKCWGVCENFSFGEVSSESVMVARLKTQSPHPSSLLEILNPNSWYNLSRKELLLSRL